MTPDDSDPANPEEWFRVMSFNVRVDQASDGEDAWTHRAGEAASVIRLHEPDVVGCQELLAHQLSDLREALPAYAWVGEDRKAGDRPGEHVAIGYRTDRFTPRDHDTFWLSETPDVPGSVGWDGYHPRIATWVRLEDSVTDADLLHLNTHLDHEGPRARREGARLVLERLADLRAGAPVAVGGDYNCTTDGEAYAVLTGEGDAESPLADARTATPHRAHGPTTTRTDFEELLPEMRIDHVFVDGLAVAGYGVAADLGGNDWFPSDHLPVVVDLQR